MMKEYKDERINEIIKYSLQVAYKDEEWTKGLRSIEEWNILYDDIDKTLNYVNNGKQGKLILDSNMWWVLQNALIDILGLYGLELIGERDDNYMEEVVIKDAKYIRCLIKYVDENSSMEVIIKTNDEVLEDEDDKIFFYGLSLVQIQDAIRQEKILESEWQILEILEVMKEVF